MTCTESPGQRGCRLITPRTLRAGEDTSCVTDIPARARGGVRPGASPGHSGSPRPAPRPGPPSDRTRSPQACTLGPGTCRGWRGGGRTAGRRLRSPDPDGEAPAPPPTPDGNRRGPGGAPLAALKSAAGLAGCRRWAVLQPRPPACPPPLQGCCRGGGMAGSRCHAAPHGAPHRAPSPRDPSPKAATREEQMQYIDCISQLLAVNKLCRGNKNHRRALNHTVFFFCPTSHFRMRT